MRSSPLRGQTRTSSASLRVQRARLGVDADEMRRDAAPVVVATVLMRHGLADDAILSYLARSWPLDERDCRSALDAARILLRRERSHEGAAADE
jgi:hypothetical protein